MENLEIANQIEEPKIENQELTRISLGKFIFLSVLTAGLYEVWWTYKAWRFFQLKERSDFSPVFRTAFALFYQISLFNAILKSAKSYDYKKSYSSWLLFIGYIVYHIAVEFLIPSLNDKTTPIDLISLSFVFLIPPFNALTYVMENCKELIVPIQEGFNRRQIVLMVISGIVWLLVTYRYFFY